MNNSFTIIIPLYNKEKYIENTINSVINQSYRNFELLIIDDGSTDNSRRIVEGFTDSRINFLYRSNKGVSCTRNEAISLARNEWMVFLDADDLLHCSFLDTINQMILKNQSYKVFCTSYLVKKNSLLFPGGFALYAKDQNEVVIDNYFKFSPRNPIITASSVCIHRELCLQNQFETGILSGEDTLMWAQLGLTESIVVSPKVLVVYNIQGGNKHLGKFKLSELADWNSFYLANINHRFKNEILKYCRAYYRIYAKLAVLNEDSDSLREISKLMIMKSDYTLLVLRFYNYFPYWQKRILYFIITKTIISLKLFKKFSGKSEI